MKKYILFPALSLVFLQACQTETSNETGSTTPVAKTETGETAPMIVPPAPQKNSAPAVCNIGSLKIPNLAEAENPDRSLLDSFYRTTEQPKQAFTINNLKDTLIIGSKGTQVFVPAGCFKLKTNDAVIKNEICFEMKECYTYEDMLREHLSTQNDEFLLESQGMIFLQASVDGNELELREGHELPIIFNTEETSNTYDLFYGERNTRGEMNWKMDQLGCDASPVIYSSAYGPAESNFFDRYYTFTKEEKIAMLNTAWQTSVSFDQRGDIIGKSKSVYKDERSAPAAEKFYEVIKKYKQHVRNENFPSWGHQFSFSCIDADSAENLRAIAINREIANKIGLNLSSMINSKQTFYARVMGWQNCDQFLMLRPLAASFMFIVEKIHEKRESLREKHDAMITLEPGEGGNVDAQLVFKDHKAIVPGKVYGNKCVFENVPDGQAFYVVVTKCTRDNVYYAAKEARLDGKDININLAYTKYNSSEEVMKEYKKLDQKLE